ncbi:hypothetical protein M3611_28125, partial [Priestia megaterium]|uniref:hypothetical protein n=1 Tax=Priestia megaterium TaxID=1404 RepID=UPI00203BAB60
MLRSHRVTSSACVAGLAAVLGACLLSPLPAQADETDGTLTVTVQRDVDGNGSYDPGVDVPQAGIGVAVSDAAGASVKGTTDDEGTYTLPPTKELSGGRY